MKSALVSCFSLILLSWLLSCQKKPVSAAPFFNISKTRLAEGPGATRDSITVSASGDWLLQNTPNWLKTSTSSGNAGFSTVYFYFTANSSTDSLVADVSIIPSGNSSPAGSIHVVQQGVAASVSVDRNSLQELPMGQSDSLIITSNTAWTLSLNGAGWLTADVLAGGAGSTKVHLNASANTTGQARSASLSIQPKTGSAVPVQVQQQAALEISGFSPTSITAGSAGPVTISGVFNPALVPTVTINGIQATVLSHTASTIVISLPANVSSGNISVAFGNTTLTSTTVLTILAQGHWTKVASACAFHFTNGICFVLNSRLYVGLGNDATQQLNAGFQVFDPATNACAAGPSLPDSINPRAAPSCFVVNTGSGNKVYFGLGTDKMPQGADYRDWWQWDPAASGPQVWRRVSVLPPGGYGALNFVINNKAYAALAYKNQTLIRFDPLGSTAWIVIPVRLPAVQFPASFTIGSSAYWAGGIVNGTVIKSAWQFDQTNTALKQLADAPAPFSGGSGFSVGNLGYILTNGSTPTTYQYDPATNTWKDLLEAPSTSGYYYTGVINGVAYAWNALDGSVYRFNP